MVKLPCLWCLRAYTFDRQIMVGSNGSISSFLDETSALAGEISIVPWFSHGETSHEIAGEISRPLMPVF